MPLNQRRYHLACVWISRFDWRLLTIPCIFCLAGIPGGAFVPTISAVLSVNRYKRLGLSFLETVRCLLSTPKTKHWLLGAHFSTIRRRLQHPPSMTEYKKRPKTTPFLLQQINRFYEYTKRLVPGTTAKHRSASVHNQRRILPCVGRGDSEILSCTVHKAECATTSLVARVEPEHKFDDTTTSQVKTLTP